MTLWLLSCDSGHYTQFIKTTDKHGGSVEFALTANSNRSRSENIEALSLNILLAFNLTAIDKWVKWLMLDLPINSNVCVCLQRMGVLHTGQQVEEQADFEKMYKNGGLSLTQQWPQ